MKEVNCVELKSKRVNITKGINLNLINMDELKSSLLSVYFILPLDREDVTKNALIPIVLKMGTKIYDSSIRISQRLKELNDSWLSVDIDRKGERQVIRFSIEIPKLPHMNYDNHIVDTINLLKNIIFAPYLEEGLFSSEYVEEGKKILEQMIIKEKEDIKNYSIQRCIEEMYKNEKYSISPLGYMENLAKIDSVTLSEHYNKILSKAPMEIFFVGEYKGYIEDYLKESFKFKKNDIYKIEREYIAGKVMIKNMIYENMDIDENRLVVGYRTGIPYESSLYNGLLVANNILEDRINAENLGEITRPNKALYLVNSKINKYKSFILMDCSTSLTDIEEIIKKIRNGIDELKKGKFNEDEMRTSKQSIKGSVKAINKNGILISEFFLDKILTEDNRSYNQIIADIDKVTKEEIIEASKELTLDTIYFLRSHQNSIE